MVNNLVETTFKHFQDAITNRFDGKRIFLTSSFQTHSIPLLHLVSRIDLTIPVYFMDTGYHFPETLGFRDQVTDLLGLNLINMRPGTPKTHQRDNLGNLLFTSDPDFCCYLNKVQPLEAILVDYDVWISGVRADQTANRKKLNVFENGPNNLIRYQPILKWTSKEVNAYIAEFQLPAHPLEGRGYSSIGCMPCTRKLMGMTTNERGGRWQGLTKTECGLHTELMGREE